MNHDLPRGIVHNAPSMRFSSPNIWDYPVKLGRHCYSQHKARGLAKNILPALNLECTDFGSISLLTRTNANNGKIVINKLNDRTNPLNKESAAEETALFLICTASDISAETLNNSGSNSRPPPACATGINYALPVCRPAGRAGIATRWDRKAGKS